MPPASITTDRIHFRKLYHDYNGWYKADALWMYLSPSKCRELGLFLLAAGFHRPRRTTTLSISHPDSAIRRISLFESSAQIDDPPVGLTMVPLALRYYPKETEKHPWMYQCGAQDLPVLALSNEDDSVGQTDDDWAKRDTIWMYPDYSTLRLAELLLNAGCSWNQVREYALEGDAGYRGVGPMSAELRIFLPGSDGWLWAGEDVPDKAAF